MTGEQIWGVVRTVLAGIAGYFVTKGVVDGALVESILSGAGMIFVAVWSVFSKKKTA